MNTQSTNRSIAFVDYLFQRCQQDKGFAARMRRSDNPATEYQCWETLAAFNVKLEYANARLPFALIAAAVARSNQTENGVLRIGKAIACIFKEGNQSEQAKARLRRLLACEDTKEACRILRPLLRLMQSHVTRPLDYAALLEDLCEFHKNSSGKKACWAQQFYRNLNEKNQEEA